MDIKTETTTRSIVVRFTNPGGPANEEWQKSIWTQLKHTFSIALGRFALSRMLPNVTVVMESEEDIDFSIVLRKDNWQFAIFQPEPTIFVSLEDFGPILSIHYRDGSWKLIKAILVEPFEEEIAEFELPAHAIKRAEEILREDSHLNDRP